MDVRAAAAWTRALGLAAELDDALGDQVHPLLARRR